MDCVTGTRGSMRNLICMVSVMMVVSGGVVFGQVYRWDTGEKISDTIPETGADFSNQALDYAALDDRDLIGVQFDYAGLSFANFTYSVITDADFSGANLYAAKMGGTHIIQTDMSGANLTHLFLGNAYIRDTDFSGSDLSNAYFSGTNLGNLDFSGAVLSYANFYDSTLADSDLTGAVIAGAGLENTGITPSQLYSTVSYQNGDLNSVILIRNDLTGCNFSGQNLSSAYFDGSTLSQADFSGANIVDTSFGATTNNGFTAEQLYSTASYQNKDLGGIILAWNDLAEWDLAGQDMAEARFDYSNLSDADLSSANLPNSYFHYANLTRTDFSNADLRESGFDNSESSWTDFSGANLTRVWFYGAELENANWRGADTRGASDLRLSGWDPSRFQNLILSDGRVQGLVIDPDETMRIWDYRGGIGITVFDVMNIDDEGILRVVFEDDVWKSTISFEAGIDVTLGGTLELFIDEGVDLAELYGVTFDLFDWGGVEPLGEFDFVVLDPLVDWDISGLYTTGDVTVVPEPGTICLLGLGWIVFGRKKCFS